jgi:hypothetical protein
MTARRRAPRHFLYLDHEVADSYLSDLLGWLPEEASSTDMSSDNEHKDWTWVTGERDTAGEAEKNSPPKT